MSGPTTNNSKCKILPPTPDHIPRSVVMGESGRKASEENQAGVKIDFIEKLRLFVAPTTIAKKLTQQSPMPQLPLEPVHWDVHHG